MSRAETEKAEELVRGWLTDAGRPISPRELLRRPRPADVGPLGLRAAVWNLVDRGVARMTSDRELETIQ